jgi:hypothetical protein
LTFKVNLFFGYLRHIVTHPFLKNKQKECQKSSCWKMRAQKYDARSGNSLYVQQNRLLRKKFFRINGGMSAMASQTLLSLAVTINDHK